jgi:hypothetical protein
MRWTDNLVALATTASHAAAKKRTSRAMVKHSAVLRNLDGIVSSQILKDQLGLKRPFGVLRTMERLGMIRKVRRIPQHWEYEILEEQK